MADKKISQLTAATTPLAGSEVLPIVQSSTTVKVSVADVTKGRTIQTTGINDNNNNEVITITTTASAVNEITVANAATGANPVISATGSDTNIGITLTPKGTGNAVLTTGNLVVANGNGVDFSATSHPAGMTSELLSDYEEGTWTPTIVDSLGVPFTMTTQNGTYTKIGRMVIVQFLIAYSSKGSASAGYFAEIRGWPFSSLYTGNTTGTDIAVRQASLEISATSGRLTLSQSGLAAVGVYTLQDGAGPQLVSFYPASGSLQGTMIGFQ